ncbi:MAG TPA: hypothetical protein VFG50_09520 [Rhodothermales bacterium]|nr:hypothetical protein [Rhodothermales bacterium]
MGRNVILLIIVLAFSRCATQEQPTETAGGRDTLGAAAARPGAPVDEGVTADLPATKQDTILLEGMPEPVQLQLFRTPDSFALPFYTYHPSDMVGQLIDAGVGNTVRFTANFGGRLTDNATLEIYVYPLGRSREDAHAEMASLARDHQSSRAEEHRYPWSLEEYAFQSPELVGRYALGLHEERYFRIHVAYPPEFGDGFPPRAAVILDQWHWVDDGAKLGS